MVAVIMSFPVQLRTTLSHASPDKAAEIRSAVTGALQYDRNGMFCFERSVETTFVLPWDLNPRVEPQKLTRPVRDGIRDQLMEHTGLVFTALTAVYKHVLYNHTKYILVFMQNCIEYTCLYAKL